METVLYVVYMMKYSNIGGTFVASKTRIAKYADRVFIVAYSVPLYVHYIEILVHLIAGLNVKLGFLSYMYSIKQLLYTAQAMIQSSANGE